jgi:hypothetical protein
MTETILRYLGQLLRNYRERSERTGVADIPPSLGTLYVGMRTPLSPVVGLAEVSAQPQPGPFPSPSCSTVPGGDSL